MAAKKSIPEQMDDQLQKEMEKSFKIELTSLVNDYEPIKSKIPTLLKNKMEELHTELFDVQGLWDDLAEHIQTLDENIESDFQVSKRKK